MNPLLLPFVLLPSCTQRPYLVGEAAALPLMMEVAMPDSTRKRRPRKDADRPKKPYPEFPLTPHPSGAWQKKIRGKIHYFGRWAKRVNGKLVRIDGDGWKEALEEYKKVADDLHAGRTPRVQSDGLTVADLCNRFLTAKLRKREAGGDRRANV